MHVSLTTASFRCHVMENGFCLSLLYVVLSLLCQSKTETWQTAMTLKRQSVWGGVKGFLFGRLAGRTG